MATLTDSLLNGLKSLFSGLGKKTTDSNYAVALLKNSDASAAGYMGMADLAKVLGGDDLLARLMSLRVAESSSGDLNELTTGMVYIADQGRLTNEPPQMDQGPCAYFYFGRTSMARGIQVCFHVSNTAGAATIFMRGQLYSGWSAWKSVSLT